MARTKSFDEFLTLKKAIDLFWEKGYEATSIQDLVDHLGVNRASLYATYGDKRQLFIKACRQYQEKTQQDLRSFFGEQRDVRVGFRSLFNRSMCDSLQMQGKGCFTVNSTVALRAEQVEMSAILQENRRELEAIFRDFLQKGVTDGQISPDRDLVTLAKLLFTYYYGLTAVTKIQRGSKAEMKAVDALLEVL